MAYPAKLLPMPPTPPSSTTSDKLAQICQRETQWRRVGGLLHSLLSQLAEPTTERSGNLKATLAELRTLLRQDGVDNGRTTQLLGALAKAVKAEENAELAPVATTGEAAAAPALDELLLAILDRLQMEEHVAAEAEALRQQIADCNDADTLREHGKALVGMVARRLHSLAEDRRAAVRLLHQVSGELATMSDYLDQDDNASHEDAEARHKLDERMQSEMQVLDELADLAPDLATLRADLHGHLGAIRHCLTSMHERDQARDDAWRKRVERLRHRIATLEQSTQHMEAVLASKGHLIDTDALTGLANRRALDARMAGLCDQGNGPTSVLMVDIDHFKGINDRLGHSAGDRALRIVAEQMQAALRPGDFLARYGGEEFVAILVADSDEAMRIAERLRERLERTRFRSQLEPVQLTLSCGVSMVQAGDTPETVFERADQALYRAKRGGRNRCEML